jgi:nitrite reductase/ring-hydroxylating ferredoxin subunit
MSRPAPPTAEPATLASEPGLRSSALLDEDGHWLDRQQMHLDPAVLDAELQTLWRTAWLPVAPLEDLAEPGTQLPLDLVGHPVVAVRAQQGVRLLSNICRHRAMRLCWAPSRGSALTCPYHGWRYGLDGSLQVVPRRSREFPDLEPEHLGLPEIPSAELAGLLLGRLLEPKHPEAGPSPVDLLAGELQEHRPKELPVVVRHDLLARCNWKLLVENHLDGYHLWYLHEHSLALYDHRRFTSSFRPDGTWTSFEPLRPAAVAPQGLPAVPGLARWGMGAHLLFPALLLVTSPWWLATYWLEPEDPGRTRVHLVARGAPGCDPQALLRDVLGFITEDVAACEAVQEALASGTPEGPLARTLERDLVGFRRLIAEALHAAG